MRIVFLITAAWLVCTAAMADETKTTEPKTDGEVKTLEATVVKSAETTDTATPATADMTVCKNGSNVRNIVVKYDDASTKVPCQVHYQKETEIPGHDEVLWTAQNDAEYCVRKAQEFVQKQEGWGWLCQGG